MQWGDGAEGNWIGVAGGVGFCVALKCGILPIPGVAGVVWVGVMWVGPPLKGRASKTLSSLVVRDKIAHFERAPNSIPAGPVVA